MVALVNGKAVTNISIADRGLLYGDGFFTTLEVAQGQPALWPNHVARLNQCANALFGWEALPSSLIASLLDDIAQVARPYQTCGVRITMTRGEGGRGYAPPAERTPQELTRIVTAFPFPTHYYSCQTTGIAAEVAHFYLADTHPRLVGLKTLNRLEQVMIKQELVARGVDELIVLDNQGHIVEASVGNVFWRKGRTWFTPPLLKSGIHGVARAALLTKYPQVQTIEAGIEALQSADEAFVCNGLMKQVSLKQLGEYSFPVVRNYALHPEWVLLDC